MIGKIRGSLPAKVFLMTAVLMAACCSVTFLCMLRFAPYIYTRDFSSIDEELPFFLEELSHYTKEEAFLILDEYAGRIVEENDGEFVFCSFPSESEALGRYDRADTSQWCRLTFADSKEAYTVFFAKNTELESQAAGALRKAVPVLSVVIMAVSVVAAFFYTVYLTAPVRSISRISKRMASLDFSGLCTVRRTDEIGVLAGSLNALSEKLSSALSELQSANRRLQAEIDRERELERQRIDFFSAASHELKTPITILKGQLQGMLCQVGRYRDRETYLAESLAAAGTLENMVGELLTAARLDAPGYVCRKSRLDFSGLLEERLSAQEDLFMQRDLAVEKDIPPAVFVQGDAGLLRKVLDNLLGNAAAYSPAGNRLFVKLRQDAGGVTLAVENTGVRIPDSELPRLFEAFYRVDRSRSRQTGGTGLGLSIVKTILDLHGAEIRIENTGRGVLASVHFPDSGD